MENKFHIIQVIQIVVKSQTNLKIYIYYRILEVQDVFIMLREKSNH